MNNTVRKSDETLAAELGSATEAKPRILVVDDVADNRDILVRRLVRRDFEVEEASGGVEALKKIGAGKFDVVLLDIMMPDMNGNDVLAEIRKSYGPLELPVVMVTAKSQSDDLAESLESGANDYITKPVDFTIALARINAQLSAKRRADDEVRAKSELASKATTLDMEVQRQAKTLAEKEGEIKRQHEMRRYSEEKLRYLAFHDPLTGLLNRRAFHDELSAVLETRENFADEPVLLFVDLDRFKFVNDNFGHETGDKLLCAVTERLKNVVGENVPMARVGGDEFAVILNDPNAPEGSMAIANRLVKVMAEPFVIDNKTLSIGCSCGVALATACDGDLDILMKAADLAMYNAKGGKGNGAVLFETKMLEEENKKAELEAHLRLAVKHGEFEVFYQPQIDIKTRKVTCFEALVRWNHPTRGLISPEVFIPLAEEIGLIVPIGETVLRKACEEAVKWPEDVRIAVNVSPVQFRNPSLLPLIVNTLAKTGLKPSRLEIEITESALLGAEKSNVEILRAIRELGVRVSMDDFGTGYSSLGYLQNFEFDKIKIDRRFVQEIERKPSNSAIIRAIVGLGATIGISTIAEGVETEEQLKSVDELGCLEAQGYLFSRPLVIEDAKDYLERMLKSHGLNDD